MFIHGNNYINDGLSMNPQEYLIFCVVVDVINAEVFHLHDVNYRVLSMYSVWLIYFI